MDMQGSRQLAVTQQQAWDALNDPEVLKVCIPGCDSLESTGENAYALVNAFKVGPVSAKFKSALTLADIQAPSSYTIHFDGSGGAAGFGKGTAKVALTANEGGCLLDYTANASVGGKIAQVGQRLIDGVAKSMAEKFFKNFDDEMQRRHPAPAGAVAATADSATTPAAPVGVPKWVWWALGVIIILGIVFVVY
jgi:carbon monoxide dehydrogenase subunit G